MVRLNVLIAFCIALFAVSAIAQEPEYQAASEVTMRGEVLYVAESAASWAGVYVIVKDRNNEIEIHLAPAPFLAKERIDLKVGDTIKVTGSRTQWKSSEIVLARELTAHSRTVQLRSASGAPLW